MYFFFFYTSVECDFFGEEPLCIDRHRGWDDAVFAGELARSARRQEMPPARRDLGKAASSPCLRFSSSEVELTVPPFYPKSPSWWLVMKYWKLLLVACP